eukprot:474223-Amphidinium_carterae.1
MEKTRRNFHKNNHSSGINYRKSESLRVRAKHVTAKLRKATNEISAAAGPLGTTGSQWTRAGLQHLALLSSYDFKCAPRIT